MLLILQRLQFVLGKKEVAVSLHNLDEMFAVANEMLHLALEAYEQEKFNFCETNC